MPLSPELKYFPMITGKFITSGLLPEVVASLVSRKPERDFVADARRLVSEFKKDRNITIEGLEKIPKGGIIFFNHPNMDVLMPGMLDLIVRLHETSEINVSLVMASEIMIAASFNDKQAIPGSVKFMERFHKMYYPNIISAPTVTGRKDFLNGRAVAVRKIMNTVSNGNLVIISPEGHIEKGNEISPISTFHSGSGALGRFATKLGIPGIQVAFWSMGPKFDILVRIGDPFWVDLDDDNLATDEIMRRVARLMPVELRGPYK